MLEIPIPKEVRKYKTKLVGNMTTRQTVCFVIAAIIALLVFNLLPSPKVITPEPEVNQKIVIDMETGEEIINQESSVDEIPAEVETTPGVSVNTKMTITFFLVIPVIMAGWLEPYGMPFEQFIKAAFFYNFLAPTKRKYKIKNYFEELVNSEPEKPIKYKKSKEGFK